MGPNLPQHDFYVFTQFRNNNSEAEFNSIMLKIKNTTSKLQLIETSLMMKMDRTHQIKVLLVATVNLTTSYIYIS